MERANVIVKTVFYTLALPALYSLYGVVCLPFWIVAWTLCFVSSKINPDMGQMASSLTVQLIETLKDFRIHISLHAKLDGQIRPTDFMERFQTRIIEAKNNTSKLTYPEFSQRIMSWLGYYFWTKYSEFDVKHHVTFYEQPINSHQIKQFIEKHKTYHLDPFEASPWHLYVFSYFVTLNVTAAVDTYVVLKIHHGLSDGISLFKALNAICDTPTIQNLRQVKKCDAFRQIACYPFRAGYDLAKFSNLVAVVDSRWLRLPFECGASYSECEVPLQMLKEIAKFYNVTMSCLLLTLVGRSLGSSLSANATECPEYIRTWIPVPKCTSRKGGMTNNFGMLQCFVPTAAKSFQEDLMFTKEIITISKRSTASFSNQIFWKLTYCLPGYLRVLMTRFTIAVYKLLGIKFGYPRLFISPFIGPTSQMSICGSDITELKFSLSDNEDNSVTCGLLSYNGTIKISAYSWNSGINCVALTQILQDQVGEIRTMMDLKCNM